MNKYRVAPLAFPSDCAPLTSDDRNNPGWAQCFADCGSRGCISCVPDDMSNCGQMVIASGIGCVPAGCTAKCCKKDPTGGILMAPKIPGRLSFRIIVLSIIAVILVILVLTALFHK